MEHLAVATVLDRRSYTPNLIINALYSCAKVIVEGHKNVGAFRGLYTLDSGYPPPPTTDSGLWISYSIHFCIPYRTCSPKMSYFTRDMKYKEGCTGGRNALFAMRTTQRDERRNFQPGVRSVCKRGTSARCHQRLQATTESEARVASVHTMQEEEVQM